MAERLGIAILLILLFCFGCMLVLEGSALAIEDELYSPQSGTLIFDPYNHQYMEELPFTTMREMLYEEGVGFYEVDEQGFILAMFIDWERQLSGPIIALSGDRCFIMLFNGIFDDDNSSYPEEAVWITCGSTQADT